jgi:micrococcal nuclease
MRRHRIAPHVPVLVVVLASCAQVPETTGEAVVVTRVYDGDTIEVEFGGSRERVRYIGIDTPERDDDRPAIRELAQSATEANRALIAGRTVRLEFDLDRRDRYGRLLAYVSVGDTLVNEWLVRNGYAEARDYPPNLYHQDRLDRAEREARAARLRLWDGRLAGQRLR